MPLYNKIIERELNDEERELGTADPLNLRGGLQILGDKYQELPEDVRANVQEAGSMLGTAWEGAKRIDNKYDPFEYAASGAAHTLEGIGKAYSAVVEPVKKELSIRTGLDPIYWDATEITADVLTPGIPLAKKSYAKILNIIDSSPFKVPNPFKVPEFAGGVGTGFGIGPDDIKPTKITETDLPGPTAGPTDTTPAAWGVNQITGQENIDLARIVYEGSIDPSNRLSQVTNYKLGGPASFQKWVREEYVPLMNAAAEELGMGLEPFYSLIASKPGFKYIEHRIAKGQGMKWYWEMQGDPSIPWDVKANSIDNLRLLLDDRFKKLKDAVEVQVYGGSAGTGGINSLIPNRANRYIVDIQSTPTGRRYSSLDQNAGDVVIRKAGSGEEVGRIGEYYNVLFSSTDDLLQKLPLKFPELKGLTRAAQKDWIREWRKGIINEHLEIIRNKEGALKGLSEQEKLEKINIALIDDMVDFRQEYEGVLPFLSKGEWALYEKGMKYEEIRKLQMMQTPPPPDGVSLLNQSIQSGKSQARKLRPLFKGYTKTLESQTTKIKGTGRVENKLDEILRIKKDDK